MEKVLHAYYEQAAGDIARLRSRLTGVLIGLARATDGNGLFATGTNADSDAATLKALIRKVELEKAKLSPECLTCAAPCGRKDN